MKQTQYKWYCRNNAFNTNNWWSNNKWCEFTFNKYFTLIISKASCSLLKIIWSIYSIKHHYLHWIYRNRNLYLPLCMPAVFVVVRRNLYNFGLPIWYLYLEMNTFANQFVISYIFIQCTSTVGMFKGICRFHYNDNITYILFNSSNCADYLNNCVVFAVWRIACAMWSSKI